MRATSARAAGGRSIAARRSATKPAGTAAVAAVTAHAPL